MKIYRLKKLFSTPKDAASLPEERRRRRRLDAALGGGLLLAMLLSPLAGFGQQCAQVRQDVLRLHILANSDSPEDQALKLQVRDAVLLETEDLFSGAATLAPMAAGMEYPMVPMPPEVKNFPFRKTAASFRCGRS